MPPEREDRRPVDPGSGQPLPTRAQPGYYPGYSTLGQQAFWDEATRDVVLKRVREIPPMRFFAGAEEVLFRAVVDCVLPQDDRDEAHRIPVAEMMDWSIAEGHIDGYQYTDMPPMQEAHRLGLLAINDIAWHLHGRSFVELSLEQQDEVLMTIRGGSPPVPQDVWERMSPNHYWTLLLQAAVDAYYSHPYAWDEIGFGGPAYPRAYFRLERGEAEPWEVDEVRYEWDPPPAARSHHYNALSGDHPHMGGPGTGAGATH
jgi:hypothetical protein